jgi:hypothetical protein
MHRALPFLLALPLLSVAQAAAVVCHVNYGGETQLIRADAKPSPYTVAPVAIGSYFLFRAVVETRPPALAAVKLYTYADRDDAALPIHQASYPYPPHNISRYGFTGLQTVYEPLRDGELQYWCEMAIRKVKP